jgi:hypothetical protein
MQRNLVFLLLSAVLIFSACKKSHPLVAGRLIDEQTQQGIAGETVEIGYQYNEDIWDIISNQSSKVLAVTTTDDKGYFSFEDVDLDNKIRRTSTYVYVSSIDYFNLYSGEIASRIDRTKTSYYFDFNVVFRFKRFALDIRPTAGLVYDDTLRVKVFSKYVNDIQHQPFPLLQRELTGYPGGNFYLDVEGGPTGTYTIEVYKNVNGVISQNVITTEVVRDEDKFVPIEF